MNKIARFLYVPKSGEVCDSSGNGIEEMMSHSKICTKSVARIDEED